MTLTLPDSVTQAPAVITAEYTTSLDAHKLNRLSRSERERVLSFNGDTSKWQPPATIFHAFCRSLSNAHQPCGGQWSYVAEGGIAAPYEIMRCTRCGAMCRMSMND